MMAAEEDVLRPGEILLQGQSLISRNRRCMLSLLETQEDYGNLALYVTDESGNISRKFSSDTGNRGYPAVFAKMEEDGNFAMFYRRPPNYELIAHPDFRIWQTDTHGYRKDGFPDVFLQVWDTGDIAIVSSYYGIWRRGALGSYKV